VNIAREVEMSGPLHSKERARARQLSRRLRWRAARLLPARRSYFEQYGRSAKR
jgi:hypothetical protein